MHPKRIANPDAKCPHHPKKEYRVLVQACWDQGWWCEKRKSGAIWVCPVNTEEAGILIHQTPSAGKRSLENKIGLLRLKGLAI
jgi:hypothetical protein